MVGWGKPKAVMVVRPSTSPKRPEWEKQKGQKKGHQLAEFGLPST